MTREDTPRNDEPKLQVIEGGGQDTPLDRLQQIKLHHRNFLTELKELGMNVEVFISFLDNQDGTLFVLLAELHKQYDHHTTTDPDSEITAGIARAIALVESILGIYHFCKDFIKIADKGSSEAVDFKKQTQLEIIEEEMLTQNEKDILLQITEKYSPRIKGLDTKNPQEIADFKGLSLQGVSNTEESDSNVTSIERAKNYKRE